MRPSLTQIVSAICLTLYSAQARAADSDGDEISDAMEASNGSHPAKSGKYQYIIVGFGKANLHLAQRTGVSTFTLGIRSLVLLTNPIENLIDFTFGSLYEGSTH